MTADLTSLRISEIFYSLQGESTTVGLPTVFVRLTGCPLRCHYCDTAYAFSGGSVFPMENVLSQVASYRAQYVTVTGGEPLAQPACHPLLQQLCNAGYNVSLETSGALDVSAVDARVSKVMDVKTPSSGESRRNLDSNIDSLASHDQVKYVIGDRDDYEWSKQHVQQYQLQGRCEVLFSPVYGKVAPDCLADWILADRLAVRFPVRLHKVLWGDAPGK
mgnify:CR=1 FL=1